MPSLGECEAETHEITIGVKAYTGHGVDHFAVGQRIRAASIPIVFVSFIGF